MLGEGQLLCFKRKRSLKYDNVKQFVLNVYEQNVNVFKDILFRDLFIFWFY